MSEIIAKLSSYNLFNYLLPGVIFVYISDNFINSSFIQKDIIIGFFLYYFIGLVISRVGSIIIEPILKLFKFIEFSNYKDFVLASKKDEKLDILSESNNSYRTLISLFICLIIFSGYQSLFIAIPLIAEYKDILSIATFLAIFLFSYKKQTKYIKDRVEANKP